MHSIKKIGKLVGRNKKIASVIAASILLVVALGFTCAFNLTKDIKINVDKKVKDEAAEVIDVKGENMNRTVGEVLAANGIEADQYLVEQNLDQKIRDVDTIDVKARVQGEIDVDGQKIPFVSSADTVGDLIGDSGIVVGSDDVVTPGVDTPLTTDVNSIHIDRVEIKEEQREEEIPYETEEKEDPNLTKDEVEVDTQGVNGVKTIKEKVTYMNGQKIGSEVLSEEVTTEPVKQIQRKGTKVEQAAASTSEASAAPAAQPDDSSSSSSSASNTGTTTSVSDSDFDTIAAIVAHEGGTSYAGAAAVMSAVMNRVDAGYADGTPLGVLTAPGQFSSYLQGYYRQYLGAAIPEVRQAVQDCLNGYRMHPYRNFHAGYGSGEYIVNQTFYN